MQQQQHPLFFERPLLPPLGQPGGLLSLSGGFRDYDVPIKVTLLASASHDVTLSLPADPVYLVRLAASSSIAAGFSVVAVDSLGNTFSSSPRLSGQLANKRLPAPLQGYHAFAPSTPRLIPGWLRLQLSSAAAVDQVADLLLTFAIPVASLPAWAAGDLDLALRAIHPPVSETGGASLVQSAAAPSRPFAFGAIGDNVIFPGVADRAAAIVGLDLHTDGNSSFALYAGVPGGAANRLLVGRKVNHTGQFTYIEAPGVAHFELQPGEALLLNQPAAADWAGAVRFRLL